MRILISNDDGVQAQGLAALTKMASHIGEVIVVAPDRQRSASSHGISLHRRLRVEQVQVTGARAAYAVSGTPVDCCKWALATIHPEMPFDLVLSGINAGANLATDVLYSGTVAIAGEAALQGVKAIALSHVGPPFDFSSAAQASAEIVRMLMPIDFPADTFVSVNIPYVGEGRMWRQEDAVWTKLGVRRYHDVFTPELDADGQQVYRYGGDMIDEIGDGSVDLGVVRSGRISMTPLRYRFTDESFLSQWTNEI
ncbi:5'-nucleotidase /3'-nucleotidase /exopolyphosphatase [Alicyclobacillus sacchari]|uniref:5'-nucleotidase SurE n=1 Tax=Alicyclobacillus sacchari TaxID=392010 RepID=A0A4V3HEX7_9BACL|nr:5'/3'-nucleotidase SurE [Alicyclobacillus sacchari]TDY50691.1 5'-nucleotidase /3'-nucleotidase /exopolyphosphatase [Alicyclobacillus sacchari]GMA55671.1 5'-nucleotidase SurE [Alicyclobacillus sacchari]